MNPELKEVKEVLMNEHWTENLHYGLKELSQGDAKEIVESMDEYEIDSKVNIRQFQNDYIADYIEYLWDISRSAYWQHIIISLNPDTEVGLLWSDNMSHVEKMCTTDIPQNVMNAVLNFVYKSNNSQDLEALTEVIKSQVKTFSKQNQIKVFSSSLPIEDQKTFNTKIEGMLVSESVYDFT
ncbi:MAG: hypothetical protein ACRC2U_19285 [Aeromonas sp.]